MVYLNGPDDYSILRTERPADGHAVFEKFTAARTELVRRLRATRDAYAAAGRAASLLREQDAEDD